MIIGVKNRAIALIGSFLAIGMGVYIILIYNSVLPVEFFSKFQFFIRLPLVEGIYPLHIVIGNLGLRTYVLLGGGAIGLIGGIMGTSD